MKKLIAVCACVLCLTGCGSSQKPENWAGNFAQGIAKNAKPMKFSSDDEFNKYARGFWVCEGKDDNGEFYKIRFFVDKAGLSWDFSVPSGKTFDDYIKDLVQTSEQKNVTTFRSASEFLAGGTNIDGVEMSGFDIEPDLKNGAVKANGEVYGTFLSNGKFKCGDDIYTSQKSETKLNKSFIKAKEALFKEQYNDPISYKEVQPTFNDLGKKFVITGTAKLSDYFNYDYQGLETVYFCIRVTPEGGGYADSWYVYCDRFEFRKLLEDMEKSSSKQMMLICYSYYPDSLQNKMASLTDYVIL